MHAKIPDMNGLDSAVADVLASIPAGLADGKVNVSLYGLGFVGKWALPNLRKTGVNVVSCYDANQALCGTAVDGVPVHSADQIGRDKPEFVLIAARHAVAPVSAMLKRLNVDHASFDAWYVATNFEAFRRVHDNILADSRSKDVLRAILMAYLSGEKRYCATVFEKDQYFCLPTFCGTEIETYVDAGAYVGDSLEHFIWNQNGVFDMAYAFEPGARQFAALQARTERLINEWALEPASIQLIRAGLGEADYSAASTSASGQITNLTISSDADADGTKVNISSLDSFLKGKRITFLKADVEGMEMPLLKGASATISQHKPKIAICVYHYPSDLPDIANYLATLAPSYRFALRHHSPQLMETVLYCWQE